METLDNRQPGYNNPEVNNNQSLSISLEQGAGCLTGSQRNANELVKDMLLLASVQGRTDSLMTLHRSVSHEEARDENGNDPQDTDGIPSGEYDLQDFVRMCGVHPSNTNILDKISLMLDNVKECGKDIVSALLFVGANVNCVNGNLDSPLILACAKGNLTHVRLLLEAGSDVEHIGKDGDTPLIHASRHGHTQVAQLLLDYGAQMDAENAHGDTPLLCAAQYRRVHTIRCLLHEGADINHVNKSFETALMHAVCKRSVDICRDLVFAGAEVNAVDYLGNTALIYAARLDEAAIVKLLIESGAFLDQINLHGKSALWFAVCHSVVSHSPCLKLLLTSGSHIGFELHQATSAGLLKVVKELVEHGASPCQMGVHEVCLRSFPEHIERVSPFSVAILTQRLDIAQYFIDIGFLMDHDLSCLSGDERLKKFLREHGKTESISFLNSTLARPWSLERLCLTVISRSVGFNTQTRKVKVKGTGLPLVYQKLLLFQGCAKLSCE